MKTSTLMQSIAAVALVTLSAAGAQAQTTISQAKALAGNVTVGDAPGFPVKLTTPGTYQLVSNLVPPPGAGAIQVTTSSVTIDMNGFSIQGPVVCKGSAICVGGTSNDFGVRSSGRNTAVRNGSISGMQYAVQVLGDGGNIVEHMTLSYNNVGIMTIGATRVSQNVLYHHPLSAIEMHAGPISSGEGLAESNVILDFGNVGIGAEKGASVIGNVVSGGGSPLALSTNSGLGLNVLTKNSQPWDFIGVQVSPNYCGSGGC